MKNKSLVCVVNKECIEQFKILCFSLLKNNKWFNYDINVFYSDISVAKDLLKFKETHENVILTEIDISLYEDCLLNKKWRRWNNDPFYKFEIFSLSNYSRIVYMDTDILVLGDISFLFDMTAPFGATPIKPNSGMEFVGYTNRKRFNGGVLSISNKNLGEKTKSDLIDMCGMRDYSGSQTPLNLYFQDIVEFIDVKYNCTLDIIPNKSTIFDMNVLHFFGEKKPFEVENPLLIRDGFDEYVYSNSTIGHCLSASLIYSKYKAEFYDTHIH